VFGIKRGISSLIILLFNPEIRRKLRSSFLRGDRKAVEGTVIAARNPAKPIMSQTVSPRLPVNNFCPNE
jgi:hypothetical protein